MVRQKRSADSVEEFRWSAGPGVGPAERPDAPVVSLLALTGALLAAHADGRVIVYPVEVGSERVLGVPWELCGLDSPALAMVFCGGEVVSASGSRLARVLPDGTVLEPLELDAPVGAITARHGRIYAVAGDTVYTFERDGGCWSTLHRTPVPLSDCHDIDVDRRGKHVVVCQRPDKGYVVELGTGTVVGHCCSRDNSSKLITESYARFSPVTDNLYRASSRAHNVEKLAKLGKSGRSLGWQHQLWQPSAWCTPLASSPEGRYMASRQSGVGILVWDLRTERQVLFAELDDAPGQEKFGKRARRSPAAVRPMGQGEIKVTRWANIPEQDGEATAIAVAPGAAYAATGDRHGVVTVVDAGTRRIERGDGQVIQSGCVLSVVRTGEPLVWAFTPAEWVGIQADGTVTVVDLATERISSPGSVDMAELSRPTLRIDGNELVLTGERSARAFDRRTLAPVWRADDPLPACGHLSYSGSELLAVEEAKSETRRIHRYLPRTGEHAIGPAIPPEAGYSAIGEVILNPRTGGFAMPVQRVYEEVYWQTLAPDGEPVARLSQDLRMLPDGEHAVVTGVWGWQIFSLSAPEAPLTAVKDLDITLGHAHVDLAAGMVAGQDSQTRRLHVWTLEGEPLASFDGLGEIGIDAFAFADESLWLLTCDEEGVLYRLALPLQAQKGG